MMDLFFVFKNCLQKGVLVKFLILSICTLVGSITYSMIPFFLQKTINNLAILNDDSIKYLFLMIVLYFISDLITSAASTYCQIVSISCNNSLSRAYISKLANLPIDFMKKHGPGHVTQVMNTAKASIDNVMQSCMLSILPTIVQLITAFIVLLSMNQIVITFCIFIYFLLYGALSSILIKQIAKIYLEAIMKTIDNSKTINVIMGNIETIKVYCSHKFILMNFDHSQRSLLTKWRGFYLKDILLSVIRNFLFLILMIIVLYYSALNVFSQKINIGEFVMINTYLFYICKPFESALRVLGQLVESIQGIKPFTEIMKFNIVNQFKWNHKFLLVDNVLEISNLSFSYEHDSSPSISNVNVCFKSNEVVSIIGESGAGKSTLVNLLLKLYEPCSGEILLQGRNVREIPDDIYYGKVSLVTQDIGIFNASLRYNLLIANPIATDYELVIALEKACLNTLLGKLPEGLDSEVGERGLLLSGGERQRLTIARSFLVNPDIIIYDESTSSLDDSTEDLILNNIIRHHSSRLVIFITHSPFPLKFSDRTLRISNGNLTEIN